MEQAKAEMGEKPRREAEAKLRAAMPFPLQLADPAKLGPAIEAAKAAGVARATVAAAEAKMKDSERKKAEQQLRAAMPFLLQPVDPAKLGPAIEAAKAAGVASATLAAAEAKLKEAKVKEAAAKALTEAATVVGSASTVAGSSTKGVTAKSQQADQDLHSALGKFDRNHTGKLDHKELRKALASAGLNYDSEQAKRLLAKYDKDQSGLMDFDEFKELCVNLKKVNVGIAATPSPSPAPALAAAPTMAPTQAPAAPPVAAAAPPVAVAPKATRAKGEYEYYDEVEVPKATRAKGEYEYYEVEVPAPGQEYDYYEDEPPVYAKNEAAPARDGATADAEQTQRALKALQKPSGKADYGGDGGRGAEYECASRRPCKKAEPPSPDPPILHHRISSRNCPLPPQQRYYEVAAPAAEKEYDYYEDEPLDYAAAFGKPAAAAPVAPAAPAAAAAPAAVDQYYEAAAPAKAGVSTKAASPAKAAPAMVASQRSAPTAAKSTQVVRDKAAAALLLRARKLAEAAKDPAPNKDLIPEMEEVVAELRGYATPDLEARKQVKEALGELEDLLERLEDSQAPLAQAGAMVSGVGGAAGGMVSGVGGAVGGMAHGAGRALDALTFGASSKVVDSSTAAVGSVSGAVGAPAYAAFGGAAHASGRALDKLTLGASSKILRGSPTQSVGSAKKFVMSGGKGGEDHLRAVMTKFDLNKNGKVRLLLHRSCIFTAIPIAPCSHLRDMPRASARQLDGKELRKALEAAGLKVDSDSARALLETHDNDRSGDMEFEEFKASTPYPSFRTRTFHIPFESPSCRPCASTLRRSI